MNVQSNSANCLFKKNYTIKYSYKLKVIKIKLNINSYIISHKPDDIKKHSTVCEEITPQFYGNNLLF